MSKKRREGWQRRGERDDKGEEGGMTEERRGESDGRGEEGGMTEERREG